MHHSPTHLKVSGQQMLQQLQVKPQHLMPGGIHKVEEKYLCTRHEFLQKLLIDHLLQYLF